MRGKEKRDVDSFFAGAYLVAPKWTSTFIGYIYDIVIAWI
jgi:hypothetical protein